MTSRDCYMHQNAWSAVGDYRRKQGAHGEVSDGGKMCLRGSEKRRTEQVRSILRERAMQGKRPYRFWELESTAARYAWGVRRAVYMGKRGEKGWTGSDNSS